MEDIEQMRAAFLAGGGEVTVGRPKEKSLRLSGKTWRELSRLPRAERLLLLAEKGVLTEEGA